MTAAQDGPPAPARPAAGAPAADVPPDWSSRRTRVYVELGPEARPTLLRWGSWRLRPLPVGSTHESFALSSPDGPILIDPREPAADVAHDLWARLGRPPIATVLTNDWHERDAYAIRARWGTPVWAPRTGLRQHGGDLEGEPDYAYDDATTLPGGLRAAKFEGRMPGDHLLFWTAPTPDPSPAPAPDAAPAPNPAPVTDPPHALARRTVPPGVLFTGDAINGRANQEHPGAAESPRGEPGLYVGAASYYLGHPDPSRLQDSLRLALDSLEADEIDLICGAHSEPYRDCPAETLAALLALDWSPFLRAPDWRERRFPVVRL